MKGATLFRLQPLTTDDLPLVLTWRNHPDVRKGMYTTHVISPEEHQSWFQKVSVDTSKKYFLCCDDEEPVGLIGFTEISEANKSAVWAFYSGDLTRRGVGSWMEYLALNYAFVDMKLEKLSCEVLSSNYGVVEFHRKFGFRIEGTFVNHILREDGKLDVYRLAMFKRDWLDKLKPHFDRLLLEGKRDDGPLKVGSTYKTMVSLSEDDVRAFSKVSGDTNPIHLDPDEAKKLGFKNIVVPGMLTAATLSKIFGVDFPGSGTIWASQQLNFKLPVFPGDELTVELKIVSKIGRSLTVETKFSRGAKAVLEGEARLIVP